jgi:type II secretory pathway pseudopilin PulG
MLPRRPGFTLFQLLLVLAVLLILLALLLPAVQKVRIAAARMQSSNNLKQIALACHSYADAQGGFPAGCDAKNYSAAAHLLPYIEQNNLYRLIDFTKDAGDPANANVAQTQIKLYISPLDPQAPQGARGGPTNYLFNAGAKHALADNDGVFYQGSKTRLVDIADGTSNTLMAGETTRGDGGKAAESVLRQHVLLKKEALKGLKDSAGVQDWKDGKNIAGNRGSAWIDGRFLQGTATATRRINDSRPDVDCSGAGGLSGLRNFERGTNVALCDGSVRWLSASIKQDILKALATRAGGEVISLD